jgi:subtilisin family serine protease
MTAALLLVYCTLPFHFSPPEDSASSIDFAADEVLIKVAAHQDLAAIDTEIPGQRIDVLSFGGHVYLRYRLEQGEDVEELISTLTAKPGIEAAEKNYICHECHIPDDLLYSSQYAPSVCGCEAAWETTTGNSSTVVAIIDTGVNARHADFGSGRFVDGYDFVNDLAIAANANSDDRGHGTHVAGIVGAMGDNSAGIAGVAWQVRLMAVKVLDTEGSGYISDVAAGVVWAADQDADVINMSLGSRGYSVVMADAVRYALGKGVALVASAGNEGYGITKYPAAYSGVIAVASTNVHDAVSSFSTWGSFVSVAAPGESIYSLDAFSNDGYLVKSGTSMAAPFVSGVIALLLDRQPSLTPAEVQCVLEETAVDLAPTGYDIHSGYGRVDAAAVVSAEAPVSTYGTIRVLVTNLGLPVTDNEVLLLNSAGTSVLRSARTSSGGTGGTAGVAEFPAVSAGGYKVSTALQGDLRVRDVTVTAGAVTDVTVVIAPNTAKDLTAFSFESAHNGASGLTSDCVGVITGTDISVTVSYGTPLTSLVATFSTTGEEVRIGSTVQESGLTSNDFTTPVAYVVEAEDGTTRNYTVTVEVALNPAKDLTAFSFEAAHNGASGLISDCVGTIEGTNISVTLPFGTTVTSLVATFSTTGNEVRVGSTVQESGVTPNDFTSSVTYVVEAEDSTTKSYAVSVTDWKPVGSPGFSAGIARNPCLMLDSSDTPYLAYRDEANGNKATVMKFENGVWQTVGEAGFSTGRAWDLSLALDASDTPYVAYGDQDNGTKATVMKYENGSWQIVGAAGFSAAEALFTSLALDSSDTPYVAFEDGDNSHRATVMKYQNGSWQTVGTAGIGTGDVMSMMLFVSLALDSSDIPFIAYKDWGNDRKATVMKYAGGSWQTVGTAGFSEGYVNFLTLSLDSADIPYVAYKDHADAGNPKETVMKYESGSWRTVGVAGFTAGGFRETISLSMDSSGIPFVAYSDAADDNKITVMKYESGSWQNVGTPGISAGSGYYPSLALDSSDTPLVGFMDKANDLKVTVMTPNK